MRSPKGRLVRKTVLPAEPVPHACRWSRWLAFAGFFFFVLGCRWAFVHAHALDLPTWDPWDALGETIFRHDAEGKLRWSDFFASCNEHRPALTRLLEYGLAMGNGQWDARLETAVNAVLPALLFTLLFAAGWPRVGGVWRVTWGGLLLLLGALPYGAENALSGFQSQFYFLTLGAFGYLWLTLTAERFGAGWFLGQLCAVLALFTLAAAMANGLAVSVVLGAQMLRERRVSALRVTGCALGLVYVACSMALWSPAPWHAPLHAVSLGEWSRVVSHLVSWPALVLWPFSSLLVGPVVVLAWRRWREGRLPAGEAAWVGLAVWAGLQCASIAYARGHEELWLAGRYLDLLVMGVPAQFLALVQLYPATASQEGGSRMRWWGWGAAAAWLTVIGIGLTQQSLEAVRGSSTYDVNRALQVRNTRAYVVSGDPAILRNAAFGTIPYPNAEVLMQRLAASGIGTLLPASVRPAFPLAARTAAERFPARTPAIVPETPPTQPVFSSLDAPSESRAQVWQSTIQRPHQAGMLRLWVAGDLAAGRSDLRLVVCSATERYEVKPDRAAGLRWKRINLPQPVGEWWIEAEDTSEAGWFAFTAPVALGRWSWIADKLLWAAPPIAGCGLFLLLAAGAVALASRRACRRVTD
jgi:hypothetical protein